MYIENAGLSSFHSSI